MILFFKIVKTLYTLISVIVILSAVELKKFGCEGSLNAGRRIWFHIFHPILKSNV